MDYMYITSKKASLRIMTLASMVRFSKSKPNLIVAIARGGLTIAHQLSDMLDLPVASFTISSYKNLKQSDHLDLTFEVGGSLENKHVLLVDDVSDSGKTFLRAVKYLKKCGATEVTTASVFVKPKTEFTPQHYVERTDAWIIFPWDQYETMKILDAKWSAEQVDQLKIKNRFKKFGIPKNAITFYFSFLGLPMEFDDIKV